MSSNQSIPSVLTLPPVPLVDVVYSPVYRQGNYRAVAVIDGQRYPLVSYTVTRYAHAATDTASITLSISNNPDFSKLLNRSAGQLQGQPTAAQLSTYTTQQLTSYLANPSASQSVHVTIYCGFDAKPSPNSLDISTLSRRFLGILDLYKPQFDEDAVTFQCRTIAAPLLDNKVTQVSANQTIASFLSEQAQAAGIDVFFNVPPGQPLVTVQEVLGREFIGGSNYASALYGEHVWDLGLKGAVFDDVDMWMDDSTLMYVAPSLVQRNTIYLVYGQNIQKFGGEHSIAYSNQVRVKIRSYQPKTKTSVSASATSDGFGGYAFIGSARQVTSKINFGTNSQTAYSVSASGVRTATTSSSTGGVFSSTSGEQTGGNSNILEYTYYFDNLSQPRVNLLTKAIWRQISQMQVRVSFTLPMTQTLLSSLAITSQFSITQSPYVLFNGIFFPRRYTESCDASGWIITPECVNTALPPGTV